MKPRNNHRWNRCIIEEGYCLSFGHGERFYQAFDKAFNLKPITLGTTEGSQSGSSPDVSIPARLSIRLSLQDKNSERHIFFEPLPPLPLVVHKKLASFQPEVDSVGYVSCQPSYSQNITVMHFKNGGATSLQRNVDMRGWKQKNE